jgi:uncharacterized protein (DUF1330 family)
MAITKWSRVPKSKAWSSFEFPTIEAAKAWYDGPAYREAREHRFKGAEYRAVIVQGV